MGSPTSKRSPDNLVPSPRRRSFEREQNAGGPTIRSLLLALSDPPPITLLAGIQGLPCRPDDMNPLRRRISLFDPEHRCPIE
jgi:hypothetical protein